MTARTHASIAAYSTGVPTLVVGYSLKAKGIAKDLFGSYEDYVMPVQELKSQEDLWNKFQFIVENETQIKQELINKTEQYIKNLQKAAEVVTELQKE